MDHIAYLDFKLFFRVDKIQANSVYCTKIQAELSYIMWEVQIWFPLPLSLTIQMKSIIKILSAPELIFFC
jgi:hypothetical protein